MGFIRKKDHRGSVALYGFFISLLVSGVSFSLYSIAYEMSAVQKNFLYSSQSFYAAETGIEKGLFQFKINPSMDSFVGQKEIINENRQKKQIEYRDQYFYRLEKVIEEAIPAGKSIQLYFDDKLNPAITKFHIGYLKRDPKAELTNSTLCSVPKEDSTIEVGVFSSLHEDPGGSPITILKTVNNLCEGNFGPASKTTSQTITDEYSEAGKATIAGGRCLVNAKSNVGGGIASPYENELSYYFDDIGTPDNSDNVCRLTHSNDAGSVDKYFSRSEDVLAKIDGYLNWTTLISGLDVASVFTKTGDRIVLEIRAVDDDANVIIWATDDDGNVYDIPGRYLNFTATGKSSGLEGIQNDIYKRIVVRRKINQDLLPIFDFTLFSESEFIK